MDATLPAECREPLRDLLIACADTKLLMGYHYGEWTFGAPMLESAVAHCSLAQGELGHVRLLHGILKAHFDVDPDFLVEQRPRTDFASNSYLDTAMADWPSIVAMTVVVDQSITSVMHALKDSSFAPLRSCAAKLLDEERYHLHHGQGWLRTLAAGSERTRLGDALGQAVGATVHWFGPMKQGADKSLVQAGIMTSSNFDVGQQLLADLGQLASSLGLEYEYEVDFNAWSSTRRRSAERGPGDEVLYHLRGTKNAVFKLA